MTDGQTDRQKDGRRPLQYPHRFFFFFFLSVEIINRLPREHN